MFFIKVNLWQFKIKDAKWTIDDLHDKYHCVESVQIWSYFWSVFFCIPTRYGPEITPYLGTFHAQYWMIFISVSYQQNTEFEKNNFYGISEKISLTARKMKFSTNNFFSKCDQIRSFLKKYLMENFIFCRVPLTELKTNYHTHTYMKQIGPV